MFLSLCGRFGILSPDKPCFASHFEVSRLLIFLSILHAERKVRAHSDWLFLSSIWILFPFPFYGHFHLSSAIFLGFLINITSIFGMHRFVVVYTSFVCVFQVTFVFICPCLVRKGIFFVEGIFDHDYIFNVSFVAEANWGYFINIICSWFQRFCGSMNTKDFISAMAIVLFVRSDAQTIFAFKHTLFPPIYFSLFTFYIFSSEIHMRTSY